MIIVRKFITCLSLFLVLFSSIAPTVFAATTTYTYDPNGNMTSDTQNCYVYNEANQLKQVKNCSTNQLISEYVYDYNGNRIEKKNYQNGQLVSTVYSPEDEYETKKIASTGATQNTTYYFANDQLIAKKNPDGSKNYYSNDHLGSASVVTDQNGTVVEQTAYDPWGNISSGGTNGKYQYTGQEKDSETGLDYYNARYYNPAIQHFTQADTLISDAYIPQTLNRYSYVYNNPIRYTDPSGNVGGSFCVTMGGGAQVFGNISFCENVVWGSDIAQTLQMGLSFSKGVGVASLPSAGIGLQIAGTNATNLGQLTGKSVATGATVDSYSGDYSRDDSGITTVSTSASWPTGKGTGIYSLPTDTYMHQLTLSELLLFTLSPVSAFIYIGAHNGFSNNANSSQVSANRSFVAEAATNIANKIVGNNNNNSKSQNQTNVAMNNSNINYSGNFSLNPIYNLNNSNKQYSPACQCSIR